MLSGLAVAGANDRTTTIAGEDDGILTAEEVAILDLTGVEWAVLSACDTGSGSETTTGESLRRAFQAAGVRTLIMSLWNTEDATTAEWMTTLYESRLRDGLSTTESVHRASLHTWERLRNEGRPTHPFFWAPFIATGDWR